MTEVPKIVHRRLQAAGALARADQAHPEADLLAALSEQALSETEREAVLTHLALCVDCREVVALALPEMQMAPSSVEPESEAVNSQVLRQPIFEKRPSRWFAWSNLRWAALASGVAVAILAVQFGLEHGKNQAPAAVAERTAAAATSDTVAPPASQPSPNLLPSETQPQGTESKANVAAPAPARPLVRNNRSPQPSPANPTRSFTTQTVTTQNFIGRPVSTNAASPPVSGASGVPGTASGVSASQNHASQNQKVVAEMVTVEAAPSTQEVATLSSNDRNLTTAGNQTAVERAKPVPDDMAATVAAQNITTTPNTRASGAFVLRGTARPAGTVGQLASWKISAGTLQHSPDKGVTWQLALGADRPILCYSTQAQEVWAGGQLGTLMHSADNGATWNAVPVSYHGQTLSSDITHIEIRTPADVAFETADHQNWRTTDGGKTWNKN